MYKEKNVHNFWIGYTLVLFLIHNYIFNEDGIDSSFRFSASSYLFLSIFSTISAQSSHCPNGGSIVYSGDTGIMKSPGSPNYYPNNLNCNYTVSARDPRQAVRIHFDSFQTEGTHDYLQIYFLEGNKEHKVTRLTGVIGSQPDIITAPGNGVKFLFHSDSSVTKRGFSATYSRFDVDGCNPETNTDYPGNDIARIPQVQKYSDCCKKCRENSNCVAFAWDYTGETDYKCWLKNATGTRRASGDRISGVINRSYKSCACNKLSYTATTTPQDVTSPGYPSSYCNNIKCFYVITTADAQYSVQLTLDHVDIWRATDKLVLHEGESNYTDVTNKIATISGTSNNTRVHSTRSHTMILVFSSASDRGSKGFHGKFVRIDSPCACPTGTFANPGDGRKKNFTSPGFPRNYCDKMRCEYKFQAPQGKIVKLEFRKVGLETNSDFVKAYNTMQGSDKILKAWTGNIRNPFQFVSNTEHLTLLFTTDSSTTSQGFAGNYSYISRSSNCQCPGPMPKRETASTGELKSPHYPSAYCGPLDCFWVLIPPSRTHRLVVNLTSFNTRGPKDGLMIYNGLAQSTRNALKRFFGTARAQSFSLDGSTSGLTFHFHTESAAGAGENGFFLNWQWKQKCQCTEHPLSLIASETPKFIWSPDYPQNYCNNLNCQWLITAPSYNQVHLEILTFRSESGEDFLMCYDGQTTRSNRLARWSGSFYGARRVVSSGRYLLIRFTTDGSVTFRGWRASFSSRGRGTTTRRTGVATTTPRYQRRTTTPRTVGPILTQNPSVGVKTKSGSSGWAVGGPIFLVILLIVAGVLLYFFVLRDRVELWYRQLREGPGAGISYANPTSTTAPQGYRDLHRDSHMALVTDND